MSSSMTTWRANQAQTTWWLGIPGKLQVVVRQDENGWYVACPEIALEAKALLATSNLVARRQALALVLSLAEDRARYARTMSITHKRAAEEGE